MTTLDKLTLKQKVLEMNLDQIQSKDRPLVYKQNQPMWRMTAVKWSNLTSLNVRV